MCYLPSSMVSRSDPTIAVRPWWTKFSMAWNGFKRTISISHSRIFGFRCATCVWRQNVMCLGLNFRLPMRLRSSIRRTRPQKYKCSPFSPVGSTGLFIIPRYWEEFYSEEALYRHQSPRSNAWRHSKANTEMVLPDKKPLPSMMPTK